jgi:spermidine/putrescine transport system substrate-binding protein
VKLADGTGSDDRFYEFLSSMASPESGAYLIEKYAYGHANRKSFDLVDPELVAALGLGEADAFLTQGVFYEEIPAAKRERLIVMFDDVKSGA